MLGTYEKPHGVPYIPNGENSETSVQEGLSCYSDSAFPHDFSMHIEKIRRAKKAADKLSLKKRISKIDGAPSASIAILWEMIFDYLCTAKKFSLADFNTVSGIVQKLTSAQSRGDAHDPRPNEGGNSTELTGATLAKIEAQLKLL